MGKTIRFDSKYPKSVEKMASKKQGKTRELDKESKKQKSLSKKGKRYLKGNHLQRTWPIPDEKNKGRHKV